MIGGGDSPGESPLIEAPEGLGIVPEIERRPALVYPEPSASDHDKIRRVNDEGLLACPVMGNIALFEETGEDLGVVAVKRRRGEDQVLPAAPSKLEKLAGDPGRSFVGAGLDVDNDAGLRFTQSKSLRRTVLSRAVPSGFARAFPVVLRRAF